MKREHYNIILNKIIFIHAYYKDGFKKKKKIGDKEVNKKEFYSSKQAISLDSVDLNKIVVSNKLKMKRHGNIYVVI